MLRGVQHNLFSRTSLDKLLNKIDSRNVLKDGKIEAVHDLFEQQQAYLICRLHQSLAEGLRSVKHQWIVTPYVECILRKTMDRWNRSFNDTIMFMKSIFTARCTIVQSMVLRSHVVCPSVTLVDHDHMGWKSWKLIVRTISPTSSLFVAQRSSTYSQGNMHKFWGD